MSVYGQYRTQMRGGGNGGELRWEQPEQGAEGKMKQWEGGEGRRDGGGCMVGKKEVAQAPYIVRGQ